MFIKHLIVEYNNIDDREEMAFDLSQIAQIDSKLKEVGYDTISKLIREQPSTGTNSSDGACADVSAIGLWQSLNKAFIYLKMFNLLAKSNAAKDLCDTYKDHEKAKKRSYNTRIIEVEKGTFTPAIFSCSGGKSLEATRLLKTIAAKLAVKRSETYQKIISFVRRRVAFDILKTVSSLCEEIKDQNKMIP